MARTNLSLFFLNEVSCSPDWLQTCYVAEHDLEQSAAHLSMLTGGARAGAELS